MKKELYTLLIVDPFGIYGLGIASIAERMELFESIERTTTLHDAFVIMQSNRPFDMLVTSNVSKEMAKPIYHLREDNPSLRCLAVCCPSDPEQDFQFPNQLFNGVIPSNADVNDWEEAFRNILRQESYCGQGFESLRLRLLASPSQRTHKDDLPTRRELEVLQAMAEGYNSVTIAEHMNISENTVETFRKRLMLKFDAKNGVDLIVKSIKRGWIRV